MAPTLVVLCTLIIGTTGCSYLEQHYPQYFPQQVTDTLRQTWARVDGQPVDAVQFEADNNTCRGGMERWTVEGAMRAIIWAALVGTAVISGANVSISQASEQAQRLIDLCGANANLLLPLLSRSGSAGS